MELTVINSGSSGNGYVLQNEKEALVIEAGVSLKEVKKAVGFNIGKIAGVIVTHSHLDHSGYIESFLESRLSVYVSEQTNSEIKYNGKIFPLIFETMNKFSLGNFSILPFEVKHDVSCHGFLINHPETGNILFVTDSYYIPYRFENMNNILIEANYSAEILNANIKAGKIPDVMRNRILQSHMSIETCNEALLSNDLKNVNNIVLIHLSDGNSNENDFYNKIYHSTGKAVYIASKGLKINFDKCAF